MTAKRTSTPEDAALRRFLLGQLDEPDRAEIEMHGFESDECFERLLAEEEELVEAYIRGELPEDERIAFESQYLASPRGRQQVASIRAAMEATAVRAPQPAQRALGFLRSSPIVEWLRLEPRHVVVVLVATSLVASIGLLWLVVQNRSLRSQLADVTAEANQLQDDRDGLRKAAAEARARAEAPPAGAAHSRAEGGLASAIVALALAPGVTRGDAAPRLILPESASLVVLQLHRDPGPARPSYRVVLRTVDGQEVWRQDLMAPQPADPDEPLTVMLPPRRIEGGDYLLALQGITPRRPDEDLATYYFTVTRRRVTR